MNIEATIFANCGHPSKHGQQHPWRKYGHVPVGDIDAEALTAA